MSDNRLGYALRTSASKPRPALRSTRDDTVMLTTLACRGILKGTSDRESRTSVMALAAASRAGA